MALRDRIPALLKTVKAHSCGLDHNFKLLDIFQGNLLKYLDEALSTQLKGQAYAQARQRIPPINVLRRIIDKQSKIYASGVTRQVEDGTDTDQQLLSYYEETMRPTHRLALSNEYFNMFKNVLIWPYLNGAGKPALRTIPSDRFIVYSHDLSNDETPDGVILVMGKGTNKKGRPTTIYAAYEAEEFVFFNSDKENLTAEYSKENPEGINSLKRLPCVYINRDPINLMPTQDSDTLAMTLLIPILLTDINFAHMFQAFSIVYGINLTDNGITFAPNAFWSFKTEVGSEQKPEIGTIKPEADIDAGLNLVASQFALWLNTRGIKPGAVGEISGTNFSSGIAKMLDEMDTSEDRNAQIPYFQKGEAELWDLILNSYHEVWAPKLSMPERFSAGARVTTNFAEQVPMTRRGQIVKEQAEELAAGFTTRERALKRINPQATQAEIESLVAEIEVENADDRTEAEAIVKPGAGAA